MEIEPINFNELPKWQQLLVVSNSEIITLEIIEALNSGFYKNLPLSSFQINMFKFYKKMYELSNRYEIIWPYLYNDAIILADIYAKLKKINNYENEIDNKTIINILNVAFDKKLSVVENNHFRVFYVSHSFHNNF
jgi:hypothetical protein